MSGSRVTLEWQFGETIDWDAAEVAAPTTADAAQKRPRVPSWMIRRWRRLTLIVVACVLFLAATGYGLVRRAERNLAVVEAGIRKALSDEAWIAAPRVDFHTQPPIPIIHDLELQGDIAIVRLLVAEGSEPWHAAPYRTTRFFRETERGWTATDATPDLWGQALSRETNYFRFNYRRRDAKAVEAVAEEIDALYLALRRAAGLAPPKGGDKLVIEVTPHADDRMRDHLLQTSFWKGRLLVPSPLLLLPPASLTDAQTLRSAVAPPLAARVLDEALSHHEMSCVWNQTAGGLSLWWREANSALPSMTRYRRNNTMHTWVTSTVPPTLRSLSGTVRDCRVRETPAEHVRALRTLGAKTVFEYIATEYAAPDGTHPWLAPLLEAMPMHEGWDTLIPALFGISADEFDARWQAYIAAVYGGSSQR